MYRRFRRLPPPIKEGDDKRETGLPKFPLGDGMYLTHGFLHGSGSLYKYTSCKPNPSLPNVLWSKAEFPGEAPGLNPLDRAELLAFDDSGAVSTNEAVYRSCRANVALKSGEWYFEVQIIKGNEPGSNAHVRLGLARREFALDTPVGSDAYSYGIADKGRKLHMSRPSEFGSFATGDIVGFHVMFPTHKPTGLFRTRVPFEAAGQTWFDFPDYLAKKELQELANPKVAAELPLDGEFIQGSWAKVYKNGEYMGVMAEDMREFLPPFSVIQDAIGSGANYDDGLLGYYPTISCYNGGKARFNLGPNFAFAVPEGARSCHERWQEQIADDVVLDLIDQVVFEVQDSRHPDLKPMAMGQVPFVYRQEEVEEKPKEEESWFSGEHDSIEGIHESIHDTMHDDIHETINKSLSAQPEQDLLMSAPFKPTLDHMHADWDFDSSPKRMHLEE